MKQQPLPKEHRSHVGRGFALTATLSLAAGLAGAALLYLRRKGIKPSAEVHTLRKGAKAVGTILRGESRAAYNEIHQALIEQLAQSQHKLTRATVLTTITLMLQLLKKRGVLTKQELQELAQQLQADWNTMLTAAKRRRQQ